MKSSSRNEMFVSIVIPLLLGSQVSAIPAITDPCGGSNPAAQQRTVVRDMASAVRDTATEARIYVSILEDKYTNPDDPHIRISQATAKRLSGSTLENYPKQRREYTWDEEQLKLQNDYDNISVIAVFMNKVYADEVNSKRVNLFKKEMNDFDTATKQLLCKVNMAAAAGGFEITKNVDESAMHNKYRKMNIPIRYKRDYLVFRDARIFLTAMSQDYV